MRVNRRFLYWGVFLVATGGVLVVAELAAVDSGTIADSLRLWPLAIVAIGVGLILRRTRFGVAGGLLAAAVPGLLLGGAFAVAPHFSVDCGAHGTPVSFVTNQGTFDGPATVSVTSRCGTLVVDTATGSGWVLNGGNTDNRAPVVNATSRTLSIDSGATGGWRFFDSGRDSWDLTLPTSRIDDLSLVVNAGRGQIDLAGAQLGRLDLTTNAAETIVDVSGASLTGLSGAVNAGLLSVHLPSGNDVSGSLTVNAGALQVCTPPGLGLRVTRGGVLSGIKVNGLQVSGDTWQSPDYSSATHRADLNVVINVGAVEINPIGGCR
ncbi:MAG TPA: hypothetical protein VF494_11685 [Candidatus Limnocylindrales bacterium]